MKEPDREQGDIDERKRGTITRLVQGGAFVAPVIASFAMSGLAVTSAHAQTATSSSQPRNTPPPPPPP